MKHNTRDLEGALLNTAVALALGYKHLGAVGTVEPDVVSGKPWCLSGANDWWEDLEGNIICGPCTGFPYDYSTDHARGGPITDAEHISTIWNPDDSRWEAGAPAPAAPPGAPGEEYDSDLLFEAAGPTALVAAMRVFVLMKLGEEIEL